MKVRNRMVTDLVTVERDESISEAIKLMKQHSIRHLPVVEDGALLGWVTEGDIRQAYLASVIEEITVGDIMITNPVTISADANLEDAAFLLYKHGIGGLPVLEGSRLVGIITVADIMAAFIEVMGILKETSRIDVILGDRPHAFEHVSNIIEHGGGELVSVGMSAHQDRGERVYYLRLTRCDVSAVVKGIQDAGYTVVSWTE